MAKTKKVNLDFEVRGADKAASKTRSLDNGLKGLASSALKVGGAFFAARGLISGLQNAIELAGKQEQAEKSLEVALGRRSQALLDQASALQQQTAFGDEAIIEAQALIAAFTDEEEEIKKLIPAVLDLSAAKGFDLAGAADLVSKTIGSSTNALSRYGIEVKGAVGSTERLDTLVGNLADKFGGQAVAQADTLTGSLDQMNNAVGDAAEDIGEMLAPLIIDIAKGFKGAAEAVSGFFDAMKPPAEFADRLKFVDEELKSLNDRYDYLTGLRTKASTARKEEIETLERDIAIRVKLLQEEQNEIDRINKSLAEHNKLREEDAKKFAEEDKKRREEFAKREEEQRKRMDRESEERKQKMDEEAEENFQKFDARIKEQIALREAEQARSEQQLDQLVGLGEAFANRLAMAAIEGQNMEKIITSAVKSIAAELAARAAIFGLLNVLSGGTGGMAAAAAQRTSGGFANFLLSGFTGQTPKVNNTINISGGLVSSSYVRNTLVPAINKSRSFG